MHKLVLRFLSVEAHGMDGSTWDTNTSLQGLWQRVICNLFWPADIHNDMWYGFCLHLSGP